MTCLPSQKRRGLVAAMVRAIVDQRMHLARVMAVGLRTFSAGFVAALGLSACTLEQSSGTSESDILRGTASNRRSVALIVDRDIEVSCSGTLIAPDIVLTAAHCVDNVEEIYFGYSQAMPKWQIAPDAAAQARHFRVLETAIMPGWVEGGCPMTGADVALLRLDQVVTGVTPSKLAIQSPNAGEECVVVGYGTHANDDGWDVIESEIGDAFTTGRQRQAKVRIEPPIPGNSDTFSAKGINGAHSRGDSGGPIFCNGRVAGVVSCTADRRNAVLDLEKFYAHVTASRSFIDETLARWK